MGKKASCIFIPEVNGKNSELYMELQKKHIERPLVNYIYASYTATNMADVMDNNGYKRNSQGEHYAKDVLKVIDFSTMMQEISNLTNIARTEGFIDINGSPVDFSNAKDALDRAESFNDSHKGLVASVFQHGDVFNIVLYEKNSKTNLFGNRVKKQLQSWDVIKQTFNPVGVDIDSLPQELSTNFNPTNTGLVQYLTGISQLAPQYLYRKDALLLFSLNPNLPQVQRLVSRYGSLEDAAQIVDDLNHGKTPQSLGMISSDVQRLVSAINVCQNLQGIDLKALSQQLYQIDSQIKTSSPEEDIHQKIHELNKKYKIEIDEVYRINNSIDKLSDAASEAVVTLNRQLKELEKTQGSSVQGKQKQQLIDQLLKEIKNKKYYFGMTHFLKEAAKEISQIDSMLQNTPQTGAEREKAFAMAKTLQQIKSLHDQYYNIVKALTDESLLIDENIGKQDIDNLRQEAQKLKNFFDKKERMIKSLVEDTMINIATDVIGDTAPDGRTIANVVKMGASDTSMFDWLYSMSRSSNPIIASMGSIIRNAQDSRDAKLNDIALRIRRITDTLYKAGGNTEFMYEDDGHIISDIDWAKYKEDRKNYIKYLCMSGLKGYDLKQKIEEWEDNHTEDRVVDNTNGRTEKVPDSNYRKAFPNLTSAQMQYYNDMMQLKGEIGSLLPAYAQHQYLPPQVRRNTVDAIGAGDVAKGIKNKIENIWTIREDDTEYQTNGIIDGDEYSMMSGAYNNTPLKQIPIFYINRLKDQGELLKDFSSAVQHLAGTALNYEAMNEIADVMEFMGDYVKSTPSSTKEAEVIDNKIVRMVKRLRNSNSGMTAKMVDGFLDQYLYGQKLAKSQQGIKSKLVTNLISFTSVSNLAFNAKGALSNALMGELQMMIESGAGEFYNIKDLIWAQGAVVGGASGSLMELLSNNKTHKGTLLMEMFDPTQENFEQKSHQRYYSSTFRRAISHDCTMIGYSSGEFIIHCINMYALLHHEKVLYNGRKISLFDAFETTDTQQGNKELTLKQGVTLLNGEALTPEYMDKIKKRLRYVNQSTHGAMNDEDKGLIHQYLLGRMAMNFRQWMVEHYSRRFRGRHYDSTLDEEREGYWYSMWKLFKSKDLDEAQGIKENMVQFTKDLFTFVFRASTQWDNLDDMQKYNVKRAITETVTLIALSCLSFALGEPDEHKKEFWRRWWIYQVKRLIVDTEASMPNLKMLSSILTIMNQPFAAMTKLSQLLYIFYGITNGDLFEEIQRGEHKGENRYWRNVKRYDIPLYKDIEQMQNMDEDDAIFSVFEDSPSNR